MDHTQAFQHFIMKLENFVIERGTLAPKICIDSLMIELVKGKI
jgi:hypothetical protein